MSKKRSYVLVLFFLMLFSVSFSHNVFAYGPDYPVAEKPSLTAKVLNSVENIASIYSSAVKNQKAAFISSLRDTVLKFLGFTNEEPSPIPPIPPIPPSPLSPDPLPLATSPANPENSTKTFPNYVTNNYITNTYPSTIIKGGGGSTSGLARSVSRTNSIQDDTLTSLQNQIDGLPLGDIFSTSTTRGVFSSSATGLTYATSTGIFTITSGYEIPLSASSSDWNAFYTTPSSRITAGTNLSWSSNTLNISTTPTFASTTLSSFTAGSIPFFGTGGALNQNNSNLFWDNTNARLGIGTTTPASALVVVGDINFTGSLYQNGSLFTSGGSFSTSTTRGVFSSSATGLTYATSTGIFNLTSGYEIPLSASTTEWASGYTNRITSVTNSDGTLTISPTTGAVVASLGLAKPANGGFGISNAKTDVTTGGSINNQAVATGWLNFTATAPVTITGFAAQAAGVEILITNNTSSTVTLSPENTSSSAVNRISGSISQVLQAKGSIRLKYNAPTFRWNLVQPSIVTYTSPLSLSTSNAVSITAASASVNGIVTTGSQSFAGLKEFTNNLYATTIGDTANVASIQLNSRQLLANNGSTIYVDWSGAENGSAFLSFNNSKALFSNDILATGNITGANVYSLNYNIEALGGASDSRFKTNVTSLASTSLDKILSLNPVTYNWNQTYLDKYPDTTDASSTKIGFIAQDMELLFPEVVTHRKDGFLSIDYGKLTAVLTQGMKEMYTVMNDMKTKVQSMLGWFGGDGSKFDIQGDVCVEDVCVTKQQFKKMLLDSGGNTGGSDNNSNNSTTSDTSTTTATSTSTSIVPEVVVDPKIVPEPEVVTPIEENVTPDVQTKAL